ncbi:MAG: DUF6969 family protein [Stellaceae bacterium]
MNLAEIDRMQQAAAAVLDCGRHFATRPGGLLGEIAADGSGFADWQHYPAGEVYDPSSHAQYFYHVHPAAERGAGEHGHFHAFLRAEGIPPGVRPLVLPETAIAADMARPSPQAAPVKHGARDEVCHLLAITLDLTGTPIRLFTTNRWVTGETWYRAEDVVAMLDRFVFGETERAAVSRWIAAMVWLFRPQIAALLRARDETMMTWRRRRRGNVFEDPRIEVVSSVEIDIERQLAALEHARADAAREPAHRSPALSWMNEGWGEGHAG